MKKISRRYTSTQLRYVIYETIKILFLVIDAGIKEASIAENTQKPHSLYESSNIGFFCLSKLTKYLLMFIGSLDSSQEIANSSYLRI